VGFVRVGAERVLFIGTQFSILYTSMYSPAEAATLSLRMNIHVYMVIFRTFFINIISASHVVDWLVAMAAWLRTSCDRVEMFGNTGMATFQ
jgi:hypothetical protein